MEPVAARLARIAQKVRDRGVRLGRRRTEDELRAFERRHGVTLPDGYRGFLSHVGDGGAGPPDYGLAALGAAAEDMTAAAEARAWADLPHVGKPFPFTRPWVWEEGDESDEGGFDQREHGCVYLGNDGCGMYWFLVVTGPERGNVWMVCGEGLQPTSPKRDFLRWYEDWLDGVREWWDD